MNIDAYRVDPVSPFRQHPLVNAFDVYAIGGLEHVLPRKLCARGVLNLKY